MKRQLFRLMAMLTALCLLSGCGASAGGSQAKTSSAETSVHNEEGTTAEAEDVSDGTEADTSDADSVVEEEPIVNSTLEYFPLEETEKISIMIMTNPTISNYCSDPYEFRLYQELQNRLNIELDITSVGADQISTVVPLMISSLDMPNVLFSAGFLGNYDTALDNDIIADLTEAVEEYMPNYNAIRTADETLRKNTTTDSGRVAAIYGIYEDGNIIERGPFIRQDWLNELDLEAPVTYEEYEDVLSAFKSEYDAKAPYHISPDGGVTSNYLSAGYGVATDTFGRYAFVVVDGEVQYCPVMDGYREYLTMLNRWYEKGLINPDFAALSYNGGNFDTSWIGSNDIGILIAQPEQLDEFNNLASDPDFELTAIKDARKNADDVNHLQSPGQVLGLNYNIAADVEDLELVCRYMDYLYTDEGYLLANYGIEGESYEMVDGKPQFTDIMYNNDSSFSVMLSLYAYGNNGAYLINSHDRFAKYKETGAVWYEDDNSYFFDGDIYAIDTTGALSYYNDIATYVSECAPKFIMGSMSLDDWDDYVANIKELGGDECTAALQESVDNYNNR